MAESGGVLNSVKLNYFYHVGRCRSFRDAGRHLGVAQSALSRHIQSLETELGVVLFHRNARTTKMTEAGETLFGRVEEMLTVMAGIRHDMDELRGHPKGITTLAMPASFASAFLPQFLPSFMSAFPDVQIRILEGSSYGVEDLLLSGKADLAVVVARDGVKHLNQEELMTEELYAVGRDSLGDPETERLSFADFVRLPLVLPLPPYGTRKLLDDAARREGVELRPVLEVDSTHILKQLVMSEGLYTIMPGIACMRELAAGQLHAIRLSPGISRTLAIATPSGVATSRATRALAQHIRLWTQTEHEVQALSGQGSFPDDAPPAPTSPGSDTSTSLSPSGNLALQ